MSNLQDRAHAALMLSEAAKNLYHINEQKEATRLAREAGALFSNDIGQTSATPGDSGQTSAPTDATAKCGCGAPDCVDNGGPTLYEAILSEALGVDTGDLHINEKNQVFVKGKLVGYAVLRR